MERAGQGGILMPGGISEPLDVACGDTWGQSWGNSWTDDPRINDSMVPTSVIPWFQLQSFHDSKEDPPQGGHRDNPSAPLGIHVVSHRVGLCHGCSQGAASHDSSRICLHPLPEAHPANSTAPPCNCLGFWQFYNPKFAPSGKLWQLMIHCCAGIFLMMSQYPSMERSSAERENKNLEQNAPRTTWIGRGCPVLPVPSKIFGIILLKAFSWVSSSSLKPVWKGAVKKVSMGAFLTFQEVDFDITNYLLALTKTGKNQSQSFGRT